MASTYNLETSEIWAWKKNMCSITRDIRIQLYALRQIFFACSFATPHSSVKFWTLAPLSVHFKSLVGSVLFIVLALSVFCFCVFVLFVFAPYILLPVLPVSLDCPFLIALLVFSIVYLSFWDTCISHYNFSMQMSVFFSIYPLLSH